MAIRKSVVSMALQEVELTPNASLVSTLKLNCDSATGTVDCTKSASFLRHPVGGLATFDHIYTAPGRYRVSVLAHRLVLETNKSETVMSNISVDVAVRPSLKDDVGPVFLLVRDPAYVDEPLRHIILMRNRTKDVEVTVECDDDDGRRSMEVVEASTMSTLQDIIGSDRYRNRYRIADSYRPGSADVDEITATYIRLDVVHTVHHAGEHRITATVSRSSPGHRDSLTLSTSVAVRRRPTLADQLGVVVIMSHRPLYVDESVELLYAVQKPRGRLKYRLDFGDGFQWSADSVNGMIQLPGLANSSDLELLGKLRVNY